MTDRRRLARRLAWAAGGLYVGGPVLLALLLSVAPAGGGWTYLSFAMTVGFLIFALGMACFVAALVLVGPTGRASR